MSTYDATLPEIEADISVLETARIELHALEQIKQIPGDVSEAILKISMEDIKESLGYTPALEAKKKDAGELGVGDVIIQALKALGRFIKSLFKKVLDFFSGKSKETKKEEKRAESLYDKLSKIDKSILESIDIVAGQALSIRAGDMPLPHFVDKSTDFMMTALYIMRGIYDFAEQVEDTTTYEKAVSTLTTYLKSNDSPLSMENVSRNDGFPKFAIRRMPDGVMLSIEVTESAQDALDDGECIAGEVGGWVSDNPNGKKVSADYLRFAIRQIPSETLSNDLKNAETNLKIFQKRMDSKIAQVVAAAKKGDVDDTTAKIVRIVATDTPKIVSTFGTKPVNYVHKTYKLVNDLGESILAQAIAKQHAEQSKKKGK